MPPSILGSSRRLVFLKPLVLFHLEVISLGKSGLEKSLPSPLTGLSVDLLVALPGVQEALTAGAGGGQASQGHQQ